jgi:hypothetical protein
MHLFWYKTASLLRFFIGYWILKRGWVSTRLLIFSTGPHHQINSINQIPITFTLLKKRHGRYTDY